MYYGHIGTKASKHQERRECDDHEWQVRHEGVALQLSKINAHLMVQYPDGFTRMICTDLFPDPKLR